MTYKNLFVFEDWADSLSNAIYDRKNHGETLTADAAAGTATIATTTDANVHTSYWTAGSGARVDDFYLIPVDGGTEYRLTWTMSGTSSSSQVYYVPMRADKTYVNSSPAYVGLGTSGPGQQSRTFTTPAGCRYLQLFFNVHDTDKSMTFGNIRLWPAATFRFGGSGRAGCSSIEVEPFTPICSRPPIGGSTSMTLNVPVPRFAPAIPPEDCVCFEFEPGKVEADIKTSCHENELGIDVEIKISPDPDDCCSGKYTITPTLDMTIPCIPFEVDPAGTVGAGQMSPAGAAIVVRNKSGDPENGFDGGVNGVSMRKDCCTLTPVVDVTVPDCKKWYNPDDIPDVQITACNRTADGKVETKEFKLIEMVQDPEHCVTYPKVLPINLPCCSLPDFEQTETKALTNGGTGSITLKLQRVDCVTRMSLDVTPIEIPIPVINVPPMCLETASGDVTVTYTDEAGTEHESTVTNGIRLTANNDGACKKYTPSVSINLGTLNLSGFGNDGTVFMSSDEDDDNLYIDGTIDLAKTTWYGGGYGDRANNSHAADVFCRGPKMRNGMSPLATGTADTNDYPVPDFITTTTTQNPGFMLTNATGQQATARWASSRKANDGTLATGPVTDTVEGEEHTYQLGNLSMVMPTGFQWHNRGIAVVLTHFWWADSGILGAVNETNTAVLLAPAPAVHKNHVRNNVNLEGQNASGLVLDPDNRATVTDGLAVNDGPGLRIFGLDAKTQDTEITGTNAATKVGRLEVYAHNDDFKFTDDTSGSVLDGGKLVLNDAYDSGLKDLIPCPITWEGSGYSSSNMWTRDAQYNGCTLPVIAPHLSAQTPATSTAPAIRYWAKDTHGVYRPSFTYWNSLVGGFGDTAASNTLHGYQYAADHASDTATAVGYLKDFNAKLLEFIEHLHVMLSTFSATWLHFGRAGMLIGADITRDPSAITRRAPAPST